MKQYALCYVEHSGRVLLVEKRKPAWQYGKYNLPGGHIEAGETPEQAAERELFEETDLLAIESKKLGEIVGSDWVVHVIHCKTLNSAILKKTSEPVLWLPLGEAVSSPNVIPNLRVIIPLAVFRAAGWTIYEGPHLPQNQCTVELPCEYLPI